MEKAREIIILMDGAVVSQVCVVGDVLCVGEKSLRRSRSGRVYRQCCKRKRQSSVTTTQEFVRPLATSIGNAGASAIMPLLSTNSRFPPS
jgi:hypothetical protein